MRGILSHKALLSIIIIGLLVFSLVGCIKSAKDNKTINFPSDPVKIIVPYSPGGGVDTATRTIQPFLEIAIGQKLVVENRPGGGMSIGYNHVADSANDGYTLLAAPIPTMIFTDLTLDKLKAKFLDFKPIGSWINEDCSPLIVSADSQYKNVSDFIAAAKQKKLKLGLSGGAYSTDHMTYAMLAEVTGVEFNLVPYDSSGDALAALQGGHVDAIFASLTRGIVAHESGNAKILAVSTRERASILPDVPTFIEEGYDVVTEFHIGLFAPPDTPNEIIQYLSEKLITAANSDEFKKRANEVKSPVGKPMNSEEWKKYCGDEYNRWKEKMKVLQAHPIG